MSHFVIIAAQSAGGPFQWFMDNPFAGIMVLTFVLLALAALFGPKEEEAKELAPTPASKSTSEQLKEAPATPETPSKEDAPETKEPPVAPPDEEAKEAKDDAPVVSEPEEEAEETPVPVEVKEDKPKPKTKKEQKKDEPKEVDDEETRAEKLKQRQEKRKAHVSQIKFQDENIKPRTVAEGLEATRKGWISKLGDLLRGKKEIDEDILDELEEVLYSADIGTRTVQRLLQDIEERLERDALNDPDQVREAIKDEIYKIIDIEAPELNFESDDEGPFVVMVVGVNGVGKTTTIGKLAARLSSQGKKVLVGAADTFRAAAVEQLELWAERTDAQVIKGNDGQDPSSVVFDAVQAGVARGVDVVLVDTAGRLHTKQNLMEELKKVKRTMARAHGPAPHEVLLVLDATTGQNAINQAKQFGEAVNVSSIALTKLDGTSKGGVVVAICEELKLPIRFIGVGEHIDELKRFSANDFVEALFQ